MYEVLHILHGKIKGELRNIKVGYFRKTTVQTIFLD